MLHSNFIRRADTRSKPRENVTIFLTVEAKKSYQYIKIQQRQGLKGIFLLQLQWTLPRYQNSFLIGNTHSTYSIVSKRIGQNSSFIQGRISRGVLQHHQHALSGPRGAEDSSSKCPLIYIISVLKPNQRY